MRDGGGPAHVDFEFDLAHGRCPAQGRARTLEEAEALVTRVDAVTALMQETSTRQLSIADLFTFDLMQVKVGKRLRHAVRASVEVRD